VEFHGTLSGYGRRDVTRAGGKTTGLVSVAASWRGAIEVRLTYDSDLKRARYVIEQRPHMGAGISQHLAAGILGELDKGAAERFAAIGALDRIAAAVSQRGAKTPSELLNDIAAILLTSGRKTTRVKRRYKPRQPRASERMAQSPDCVE
jgi:hypothetical protein